MKKYIILFFFQSPSPLSLPLTVGMEYLLHKRWKKKERGTRLEAEVVMESKKAVRSFTCQVENGDLMEERAKIFSPPHSVEQHVATRQMRIVPALAVKLN